MEVTSHNPNPMTPILESAGEKAGNRQRKTEGAAGAKADASNGIGGKPESSLSQPAEQADTSAELKRGASKRRSL